MIPSAAPNRLTAPITQNSVPNHTPTVPLSASPSILMKSKLSSCTAGLPYTVEYAISENTAIVSAPITKNEKNCSMLALRHHSRQRVMLAASTRNQKPRPDGAASSSPVIGDTTRGAYEPMP